MLLEGVLVEVWLHSNASALRHEDLQRAEDWITVTEILPHASPAAIEFFQPRLMWIPREIHGVLDTTFEMDIGDKEPLHTREPVDVPAKE